MLRALLARTLLRAYHRLLPRIAALSVDGYKLVLPRGVFSPCCTLSSGLLLRALRHVRLGGVVLDYGCGSGILSVALASLPAVRLVYAYDVSSSALAATSVNVRLNGVAGKIAIVSSLRSVGRVDHVVSNPPYLPLDPVDELDAMWSAGRGLNAITSLVAFSRLALPPGGKLLMAASSLVGKAVEHALEKAGFSWRILSERNALLEKIRVYLASKRSSSPPSS